MVLANRHATKDARKRASLPNHSSPSRLRAFAVFPSLRVPQPSAGSPLAYALALGVGLASTACSPPPAGDSCAVVAPLTCPSPPPSWKNDVQPLLATYCLACHGDGGVEVAMYDYTTYQGVVEHVSTMVTQVDQCAMPPFDASPLPPMPSVEERETLLAWIRCGSPQN